MKKIILVLLFLLSSCSLITGSVSLEMMSKEASFLTLKVSNSSSQVATFTNQFQLTKIEGFKRIPITSIYDLDNVTTYELAAHEATEVIFDLRTGYPFLEAGNYELSLPYTLGMNVSQPQQATLKFKVEEDDQTIIVVGQVLYKIDSVSYLYDEVNLGLFTLSNAEDIQVGQKVKIEVQSIKESYPMQVDAFSISHLETKLDDLNLALDVIEQGIQKVQNLDKTLEKTEIYAIHVRSFNQEKNNALATILSQKLNKIVYAYTFDELENQGYTKDKVFTNGLYVELNLELNQNFTIELLKAPEKGFSYKGHVKDMGSFYKASFMNNK